jgi:hypothetical protein
MIDAAKIDTTIYIGSCAIHQPVTFFTDCIITIFCFYFYRQLNSLSNLSTSTINWKRFFLLLGLASIAGGSSHAFFAIHEGVGYKSFWFTMQALNIFSVYCAQQATLNSALQHSDKIHYLKLIYNTQLILFFVAIFIFQNFLVVVIDSAVGLVPVMVLHFIDAKKVKTSAWIACGIFVLFFAAIVNATKFSLSTYFNYLDIAHVLIIINLSLMFIGVKRAATSSVSL